MPPSPPLIRLFFYLINNLIFAISPIFGVSEGVRGHFGGHFRCSQKEILYDIL